MNPINSYMPSLKDFAKGTLSDLANQGLGQITSGPVGGIVRGAIGGFLDEAGVQSLLYPGTASEPRNVDNNLVFGARELSEQQIRQQLGEQSNFAASSLAVNLDEGKGINKNYDWRARLRPKKLGEKAIYALDKDNVGLLAPLVESGGLVWQYTPQIFSSAMVSYVENSLVGSNYPIYSFSHSTPPTIPITADFTANSIGEARYMMAVIHFVKVVTKAHFGDASLVSGAFGTPPPTLLFEYLGDNGFNKVPVLVRTYSITYDPEVDYVPVTGPKDDEVTFVPTRFTLTLDLVPNYTPHKIRKRFNIDTLRNGKGLKDGFV